VKKTFPPVQIKIIKIAKVEMAPIVKILSEVGSAFVGTPSGSSSKTLTAATSSEDGFYKGPEIALETPPLSRAEGEITRVASSILDGVIAEVGVAEEIASTILCDLARYRGTDPTFLDAVKSKYLQKHGSRAKLCPETNEWT
jgi:hypothetical protein